MANLSSPEEFPPLSSKSILPLPATTLTYRNIVATPRSGKAFVLSSSSPPEDPLDFNEAHVQVAKEEWGLSLIGYSIGRRPFYESLLSAIRKVWKLKGTMKLLSLSDGFFMLKFSSHEDYDMALAGGVWFFLGKPFVLQKWVPNFKPVREEFTSVPIWFKILDLPLPCWTPEGISRIASKVGIPLAVDDLTAEKSRLTYARVCVQVSKDCVYPEIIPITILGEPFSLKIQYEWKPEPCVHCGSIVHIPDFCLSKPPTPPADTQPPPRGRSSSRRPPRPFNKNATNQPQQILTQSAASTSQQPPEKNAISKQHSPAVDLPPPFHPPVVVIPSQTISAEASVTVIPNLNSPTEELPSSSITIPPRQQDKVLSPNRFELLQEGTKEQMPPSTSSSQRETTQIPAQPQTKASRSKQSKKAPNQSSKSQ
ncbi:hypothetical protein MA16_Dca020839 [Dendrobium catenatum]|uniref:DUF4283 domain-containing protein n=1 Tax=Dendrobium catenatum TaxID=906689 RepID=A0A2I0VYT4_9ASPA|nr:hypothetical protein MA16_Dca020839 [Dendrobium catenatum]